MNKCCDRQVRLPTHEDTDGALTCNRAAGSIPSHCVSTLIAVSQCQERHVGLRWRRVFFVC